MKFIVNTISTKRGSGGVFQIALNFILATKKYEINDVEWFYFTSTDVDSVIGKDMIAELKNRHYFVFPNQPDFRGTYCKVQRQIYEVEQKIGADIIYSISSPCYLKFHTLEVMRFANAWVTNSNSYARASLRWGEKVKMWSYCIVQRYYLRHAKFFITESKCVEKGLLRLTNLPQSHIRVVSNILPDVYVGTDTTPLPSQDASCDIACVAAPVPHKNLQILPLVLAVLSHLDKEKSYRFHVTIPKGHPMWDKMQRDMRKYGVVGHIINHGYLPQTDLISLYRRCQLCFLPTLLETFSVTSLEAMFFGLCIVATDFSFNRDVIGDAGFYFQPDSAEDAASQIFKIANSSHIQKMLRQKMEKRLMYYNDYQYNFRQTVDFLREVAQKKNNINI